MDTRWLVVLRHVHAVRVSNPADMFAVAAWFSSRREQLERWAGLGGHGLTANAFNAGIKNLQASMNNVATQRLDFQHARAERSFTEGHGNTLAQRMHRLCVVNNDDHLSEALCPLAKSMTSDP